MLIACICNESHHVKNSLNQAEICSLISCKHAQTCVYDYQEMIQIAHYIT